MAEMEGKELDEVMEAGKGMLAKFGGGGGGGGGGGAGGAAAAAEEEEEAERERHRMEATPIFMEQSLRLPLPDDEGETPKPFEVGTSFMVPLSRIAGCKGGNLSVGIPVKPAKWPLRALFSRPSDGGADAPWAKFELTVEIIDAAGLPPLLCCERLALHSGPLNAPAAHPETGGTHQRAGSRDGGDTGSAAGLEAMAAGVDAAGDNGGSSCFEVRGGSGTVTATLVEGAPGSWTIQRPGRPCWQVARREVIEGILLTAFCQGEEVALATRQPCGAHGHDDDHVQVDTLMDISSPDSLLLFCCMLALLAHLRLP